LPWLRPIVTKWVAPSRLIVVATRANWVVVRNHCEDAIRNLSSHIDVQTHAGSALHNPVTLTFDLLIPELMHAEIEP